MDDWGENYETSRTELERNLKSYRNLEKISASEVSKIRNEAIESLSLKEYLYDKKNIFSFSEHSIKKYFSKEMLGLKRTFDWAKENCSTLIKNRDLKSLNEKFSSYAEEKLGEYRDTTLEVYGSNWKFSNPDEISSKMDLFYEGLDLRLNSTKDIEIIETAIRLTLDLLKARPFYDANKRTSLLFSYAFLDKKEIPLPVIRDSEKDKYYSLMDLAFFDGTDFSSRVKEPNEKRFYSYIFNKVNDSVNRVIEKSTASVLLEEISNA
jgi:Fic family protein